MTAVRTQIEDAIVTQLATLKTTALGGAGGYLKAIKPYNGETVEELRDLLAGQAPAVLVTTGKSKIETIARSRAPRQILHLDVEILIASASARSREARLRGGVAGDTDPGIYQMLEDVRAKLLGWQPSVAHTGQLYAVDEAPFVEEADICVWQATYQVAVDVKAPDPDASAAALTAIVSSGQLPHDEEILASGTGDSFALPGGALVTLTDAGAAFITAQVGARVTIAGATTDANNGTFDITAVLGGTQLRFSNPAGVAEAFTGTWSITPQPQVVTETT